MTCFMAFTSIMARSAARRDAGYLASSATLSMIEVEAMKQVISECGWY